MRLHCQARQISEPDWQGNNTEMRPAGQINFGDQRATDAIQPGSFRRVTAIYSVGTGAGVGRSLRSGCRRN
jgi:predicted lysophospholipase L1 biosynthesis ABC-type transport system permease subunit